MSKMNMSTILLIDVTIFEKCFVFYNMVTTILILFNTTDNII